MGTYDYKAGLKELQGQQELEAGVEPHERQGAWVPRITKLGLKSYKDNKNLEAGI